MKNFILFVILFSHAVNSIGQDRVIDSLSNLISKSAEDTNRVKLLLNLSDRTYFNSPAISLEYSKKAVELSRKLGFTEGIASALNLAGEASRLTGNYPQALRMQLEALEHYRKLKNPNAEANSLSFIGIIYMDLSEYHQALSYLLSADHIRQNLPSSPNRVFALANIGISYILLNKPDSGLYYLRIAKKHNSEFNHPQLNSFILRNIGKVYNETGKPDSALYYYYAALQNSKITNESINLGTIQLSLAEFYYKLRQYDSSLFYARKAIKESQRTSQKSKILETSSLLVELHRATNNLDSAFYYEDIVTSLQDSLYGKEKFKQLQLLMLEEQQKQQEISREQEHFRNKTKMIALWSIVGVILIIVVILYRNNRHKQKTNQVLEATLSNLKQTQAQLVQSEKMASLGELTAGIAHEIQNPLNFMNNFSEVNKELLEEMKEEMNSGNNSQAKDIADDVIKNEEKINHHGKRADAIVKGMLQHSRSSSGQKVLTDINALCDEYLRLSYHGLRAKDKSFNAKFETGLDNSIEKINIVPQDIGRVLLNLINNAFYAVSEKAKQNISGYTPTVTISTKRINGKLEISVADNGNGIPETVKEKIFQPFFTTKPTGQGTGLGLSLSYDIVKAHGGEIKVDTKEREWTNFIILLPNK